MPDIDRIPVMNACNGSMVVCFKQALRMIAKGKARPIKGEVPGLELIYGVDGYDAAVEDPGVSPVAAVGKASVGRRTFFPVSKFSGEDAFPGRPVLPSFGYDMRSAGGYKV